MKFVVLNGSSKAITLSVVVHLLIVYLLSSTITVSPHIAQPVHQPIDSYLYVPPTQEQLEPIVEPEEEQQAEPLPEAEPEPEPEQIPEPETEPEPEQKPEPKQEELDVPVVETEIKNSDTEQQEVNVSVDNQPSTSVNKKFSAATSLDQLRALNDQLEDEMFEQVYIERTKPNSGSIMHGQATSVPHSVKQQSEDEKRAQATQQMGGGFAVTKGENGSCTITRDLSHVGMEGLTSVESFSCGQTEIQKAFNQHMKKWKKKYGKNNDSSN